MTDRYHPTCKTRPEEEEMCVAVECFDLGLASVEGLLQSRGNRPVTVLGIHEQTQQDFFHVGATTLFPFCMEVMGCTG